LIDFSKMKKSAYITREQGIEILNQLELQGGNGSCRAKINRIIEDIFRECEM